MSNKVKSSAKNMQQYLSNRDKILTMRKQHYWTNKDEHNSLQNTLAKQKLPYCASRELVKRKILKKAV